MALVSLSRSFSGFRSSAGGGGSGGTAAGAEGGATLATLLGDGAFPPAAGAGGPAGAGGATAGVGGDEAAGCGTWDGGATAWGFSDRRLRLVAGTADAAQQCQGGNAGDAYTGDLRPTAGRRSSLDPSR